MLTPEYLEKLDYNKVIDIYNKLNKDIVVEIIKSIDGIEDISSITKNQIKALARNNGKEIFFRALEKASNIDYETKQELKKIYLRTVKEDLKGYKELYEYRELPYELTPYQMQILNAGLLNNGGELSNFVNTIAFASEEAYVEAVDRAYQEVISGGVDYYTATNNIYKELAQKGITLTDKNGRHYQIDNAVRYSVLNGVHQTTNLINRDIEKILGCDGYEVTAHIGARPTHAEYQGKQFAVNKKDAKKYGIGLWKDVEDLWKEHNCKHTYFGIILGVSEPQYTKSEIKEMKTAKVKVDDKEVPYYEATQKQRYYERKIREKKRAIEILKECNKDTESLNNELKKYNDKYYSLCKESGINPIYERTRV